MLLFLQCININNLATNLSDYCLKKSIYIWDEKKAPITAPLLVNNKLEPKLKQIILMTSWPGPILVN